MWIGNRPDLAYGSDRIKEIHCALEGGQSSPRTAAPTHRESSMGQFTKHRSSIECPRDTYHTKNRNRYPHPPIC